MSDVTTIKVPRELRDRLARYAQARRTTLAGGLSDALDIVDEQQFWQSVRHERARTTARDRAATAAEVGAEDAVLALENLADPGDEAISRAGAW